MENIAVDPVQTLVGRERCSVVWADELLSQESWINNVIVTSSYIFWIVLVGNAILQTLPDCCLQLSGNWTILTILKHESKCTKHTTFAALFEVEMLKK